MSESLSKSMRFDVLSVEKGQDVLNKFSELQSIESFRMYPGTPGGELNRDKVVKYCVILYSYDSILNKVPLKPLEDRKLIAADLAGFERNKSGEFDDDVKLKLFDLKNFDFLRMVIDFLKYQDQYLWTTIVSVEQALMESNKLILAPLQDEKDKDNVTSMKNKLQLIPINQETKKTLDSLYKEFFTDNSDVQELHHVKDKVSLEKRARKA